MAIITCPECGGKLSSTVSACVHCGCVITVCPECNAACIGNQSECKNCGYQFQTVKKEAQQELPIKEEAKEKNCIQIYEQWKNENNYHKYVLDYSLIQIILSCASLLFIIIGLTCLGGENAWEVYHSTKKMIMFLVLSEIFAFGGQIASIVTDYQNPICFSRWIKTKKIDIKRKVEEYLSDNFAEKTQDLREKEIKIVKKIIRACVYEDLTLREKLKNKGIVSAIVLGIDTPFFPIIVANICKQIYTYGGFSFSQFSGWWLIGVFLAGLIFDVVLGIVYGKKEETSMDVWVKKNVPIGFDNWMKYCS